MKEKKSKPIASALLSRVKEGDKDLFKARYEEANYIVDLIREVIEKEISDIDLKMEREETFKSPSWAEYQAHLLGSRKMARKILNYFPK